MSGPTSRRVVIGTRQLEQLALQLGPRDAAILADLARVRILSGNQLTRLHYFSLSMHTRERLRRRVLQRLIELGLVATLDRRVGGVRAGSAGLVYALSAPGQRLLPLLGMDGPEVPGRARRPWTPSTLFLSHSLAVSELYVQLREAERAGSLVLADYRTEPASWMSNGLGGFVKPDAYLLLRLGDVDDAWAVEVDRATESLQTLRRKLLIYVDFANAGQVGPDEMTPRVFVTVPSPQRLDAVTALVADLPEPVAQLMYVALFDRAVRALLRLLKE
jgi:Replication-relaxation